MKLFTNRPNGGQTLALGLFLMFVAGLAQAQNASYTWVAPTEFEVTNAPLAASQIAGYEITCRFVPVTGSATTCTLSKTSFAGGSATSDSLTATIPAAGGQLCLVLRTRATAAAGGGLSALTASNEACKTFGAANPKPPTNLQVVKLDINIVLDSQDGFTRTVAYTITTSGPGVLAAFCKVSGPVVTEPLFTYRGQQFCKPLLNHPRTGAPNCSWVKGMSPTQEIATPCA